MLASGPLVPLDLARAEVFDYLANVSNLPTWLGPLGEGEEEVRIEADSRTGVVDVWWRAEGARTWDRLPMRLLDTGPAACVVTVGWVDEADDARGSWAGRVAELPDRLNALAVQVWQGRWRGSSGCAL